MLQSFGDEKLYAKFSKCKFWLDSISFLSHMMTKEGIMVDLAKVIAVHDWARPTSPTEIQSFISLAGYYRRLLRVSHLLQLL